MPLYQRLSTDGNWLFRWRSYLPVSVVVAGLFCMYQQQNIHHDTITAESLEIVGVSISVVGLLIRCLVVGHTPVGTSGRNTVGQIASSLNTTGMYSVVRHPLYLGNFLIGFGLAAFTLIWWFILIYSLVFWLYYERIMIAEEAFLRAQFGEAFNSWARSTPAFFPRFSQWIPADLPFSFRNVLKREYSALLQITVVAFILKYYGDWLDTHRVMPSTPSMVFLLGGVCAWTVLRFMKRKTSVLNVPGR